MGAFWGNFHHLGFIFELQEGFGLHSGAPKGVFVLFSDFGCDLGVPKSLKLELKFASKWSTDSERVFGPSGGLWGSFGARFWVHFGVDFGLPGAIRNFCEN